MKHHYFIVIVIALLSTGYSLKALYNAIPLQAVRHGRSSGNLLQNGRPVDFHLVRAILYDLVPFKSSKHITELSVSEFHIHVKASLYNIISNMHSILTKE